MAADQRIVRVELEAGSARLVAARQPRSPALLRAASWGGAALGLVCLEAELASGARPLVLALGAGVARGLPTAARTWVGAWSPLSGRLSEGSVGGDLAARLASVCDALVLSGAGLSRAQGHVLRLSLGRTGVELELLCLPELVEASPAQRWALLAAQGRTHAAALLCCGPAGERGVAFASLASGGSAPSFTGRGGLGAVLGGLGLSGLLVEAPRVSTGRHPAALELHARLARSPRLEQRAQGGSFELYQAQAARSAAGESEQARTLQSAEGRALAQEALDRGSPQHGCRGCPTPCGFVFEVADAPQGQRAHFSASNALGANLGLTRLADTLALLARCDAAGVDAKELGAVLALLARAGARGRSGQEALFGRPEALLAHIDALGRGERPELAAGAAALARTLALEPEPRVLGGLADHSGADLNVELARAAASGGGDPLRALPLASAVERDTLERWLAPLTLAPRAELPSDPASKGRLVWWQESLVAAIDASGFCAFSASGLLLDEVCSLDELAEWILPHVLIEEREAGFEGASPAQRLLACGSAIALLRRELDARHAGLAVLRTSAPRRQGALAAPSMLQEYREARGLSPLLRPTPRAWSLFASAALAVPVALERGARAPGRAPEPAASALLPTSARPPSARPGRVRLRAFGALAAALTQADALELELELPRPVHAVLEHAAQRAPLARQRLLRAPQRPLPTVYRNSQRLFAADLVHDGDTLDLVLALPGG